MVQDIMVNDGVEQVSQFLEVDLLRNIVVIPKRFLAICILVLRDVRTHDIYFALKPKFGKRLVTT